MQKDSRAFDSVVESERGAAEILRTQVDPRTGAPMAPTREQWYAYYAAITEKLMVDRGMTREERLRLLLVEFNGMAQRQHECRGDARGESRREEDCFECHCAESRARLFPSGIRDSRSVVDGQVESEAPPTG